jgi:hypothetical protein
MTRLGVGFQIGLMAVALACEAIWFPLIATWLMNAGGSRGGPGSEILFYRDRYVIPGAVMFLALVSFILLWSRRRPLLVAVWLGNALLLIGSVWLYSAAISRWD